MNTGNIFSSRNEKKSGEIRKLLDREKNENEYFNITEETNLNSNPEKSPRNISEDLTKKVLIKRKSLSETTTKEKKSIIVNAAILFISNALVSCGRMFLLNSVSSLIPDNKISSTLLSIHTFAQFMGALIFLSPIAELIRINISISVGMVFSSFLIISFYYPVNPLLLAGGFFSGLGLSIVMGSSFAYANILAYWYHRVTKDDLRSLMIAMSGSIYATTSNGYFTGNLIFSVLFHSEFTLSSNYSDNLTCGIEYCDQNLNSVKMISLTGHTYLLLITIFTSISAVGIIISGFLRDISEYKPMQGDNDKQKGCTAMKEILILAKSTPSLFLAFTFIMIGMQQAFMMSNFPKAYVSCFIGITKLGYVMMGYGLAVILMPFFYWFLMKFIGKMGLLLLIIIEIIISYSLLLFLPMENFTILLLFFIATMIGSTGSLFISLSASSYALLYPENLERTQFLANFWRCFGLMANYNTNIFLCIRSIVYIQVAITVIAIGFYFGLEVIILHRERKKSPKSTFSMN